MNTNFSHCKKLLGIFLVILSGLWNTTSAQNILKDYTTQFDNIVGKENLGINNGTFRLPDYQFIIEGRTKYFLNQGYSKGNVHYDGQQYYDVNLKYDLYENQLIFNPQNAAPNIGCNLIHEKVDSFNLHNRKFVNVDKLPSFEGKSEFHGYWQEIKIGNEFFLYIHYKKTQKNVIKNDKIFYQFDLQQSFLINYNGDFQKISSQNDILKIFPSLSEEIKRYYEAHKNLETFDPPSFYANLMNQINNLSEN